MKVSSGQSPAQAATLLLVVVATLATTACAPLLYPPSHGFPQRRGHTAMVRPPDPPIGRWDNVVGLPAGVVLGIVTANGDVHTGSFVKAGMQWLRVAGGRGDIELARADVMRVEILGHAAGGINADAVVGGAAKGAATVAGAMMLVPYLLTGDVWVPPARFWGLGAALGAAGAVQKGRLDAQSRTVYLAPGLLGGS